MEEKESMALFLCQAKGQHGRLVPQELCPPHWGIGRGYIVRGSGQRYVIGVKAVTVLHSSFFCKVSKGWGC